MLGRSRGCIGRVRASAGAASSYGRRAVATAEWAAIGIRQITVAGRRG